jgi:hypothetical protein
MAKKKPKQPKVRKHVPRQTRKFQLRLNHPVDAHVVEVLDYAKGQRSEVTMIRDGVRLLWALKNNDLTVLFELFPHLKGQFKPDAEDLIEQFSQMLLQQRAQPMLAPPVNSGEGQINTPKSLAATKIELPLIDDEDSDDTIVITRANENNGKDVMSSLFKVAF